MANVDKSISELIQELPDNTVRLLLGLRGRKIVAAKRLVLDIESEWAVLETTRSQEIDAPVILELDNGEVIVFSDWPNEFSLLVSAGEVDSSLKGLVQIDVSKRKFWQERLNQRIRSLSIFVLGTTRISCPGEHVHHSVVFPAIELIFENSEKLIIEYVPDSETICDALIVHSRCPSGDLERIELF